MLCLETMLSMLLLPHEAFPNLIILSCFVLTIPKILAFAIAGCFC